MVRQSLNHQKACMEATENLIYWKSKQSVILAQSTSRDNTFYNKNNEILRMSWPKKLECVTNDLLNSNKTNRVISSPGIEYCHEQVMY